MLKSRYQEIHIGLNLISLLRGLISLKRNRTTLLIDDYRFHAESYPMHFLTEMEVLAILRIGKTYDIPELKDLRQFLRPANVELITEETRLWLGSYSPFENLRELLRKYPDFVKPEELPIIMNGVSGEFDQYLIEELGRYENLCFESSMRPKGMRFELQGPKWFKTLYQNFSTSLNQEYSSVKNLKNKGLLHLLGIFSEEKLKTKLLPEEIPFYFFRLFSPIYRLQDFFLTTQLKRRLLLLGGDYKESSVQFWQFHNCKFENLLLASFEGVISGERVLFFSHLPEEVPFSLKTPHPIFRKTQMSSVKRKTNPFPGTNLTFITETSIMGSDRPYRVSLGQNDSTSYHWPYPDLPGSKPEFYERDLKESFEADAKMVPFEKKEAWPTTILSSSLDLREVWEERKNEAPILSQLAMTISDEEQPIKGFEYWGGFRYRSHGLLALCYGVEGI